MSEIPSLGNIGADISIALITGGAVTTWLTLFFDRRSKKRLEYVDLAKEKIKRISQSQVICANIGSYILGIGRLLVNASVTERLQEDMCIYYIAQYISTTNRLLKDFGFVQFDNLYTENVINRLAMSYRMELYSEIGYDDCTALSVMITPKTYYNSFVAELHQAKNLETLNSFKNYLNLLKLDKDRCNEIKY
jgi:hypothetical protein